MSDVTHLLSAIEQGDPHAAAQLLPLVYDELRQLAAQRLAHDLPTASRPADSRGAGGTAQGPPPQALVPLPATSLPSRQRQRRTARR